MDLFLHYLLNVFIILTPIFLYVTFWNDLRSFRYSSYKRFIYFLICSSVMVTLMYFSIKSFNGVPFDLRTIPIYIGTLLGGFPIGISLVFLQTTAHILIHGLEYLAFFFFALLSCLTILLAAYIKSKFYLTWSKQKQYMSSIIIYFVPPLFIFLFPSTILTMPRIEAFQTILFFSLTHIPTVIITLLLIDKIRMNERLQKDLQKSEQLRVVSELAASVAHEVRNPMTVARGFIQLIHSRSDLSENEKQYLLLTISELDRAQSIISDYLSLAKPEIKVNKPVNVFKVLDKVRHTIQAYALMNNVKLDMEVPKNITILGKEQELTQVILNLAKNGIESMENSGTLTLSAKENKDHVDITITDTGVGMSKEQLKQLGNAYYTTKEKGTGLGLMISYNIIHSWGGDIYVKSKLGAGTSFTIHLPNLCDNFEDLESILSNNIS
ncbi:ATP-binding protein [Evansella tamaricis]|uniref:Histidine kinase domain-containing protein n=1 Tax=Evansella tamaricis TaxID=2069301 RepID=A0ABS6JCJ2_9BACI|nr:ATP-binding protein [Evansella tamaricis]MBU9711388.1 hypothetical protein [Evansella tamaricis]